jgi:hypothetical protein
MITTQDGRRRRFVPSPRPPWRPEKMKRRERSGVLNTYVPKTDVLYSNFQFAREEKKRASTTTNMTAERSGDDTTTTTRRGRLVVVVEKVEESFSAVSIVVVGTEEEVARR